MTSLFDLSGRTALVTGSTRGLGRAMAFSLPRPGHVSFSTTPMTRSVVWPVKGRSRRPATSRCWSVHRS